jgi:hypothetical protein
MLSVKGCKMVQPDKKSRFLNWKAGFFRFSSRKIRKKMKNVKNVVIVLLFEMIANSIYGKMLGVVGAPSNLG